MENTFNYNNPLVSELEDWDTIEVVVKIKAVAHKFVSDWDGVDGFVLEFLDTHKVYEGEPYIKLCKAADGEIHKYFKGMKLFTKDGRRMGNAEVTNHEGVYNVIRTDKGNIARLTDDEVEEIFYTTKRK